MKKTIAILLAFVLSVGLIFPISSVFVSSEAPLDAPFFYSFGTKTELLGNWNAENAENVGTAFRSTAASSVELNSGVQDFILNFKVKVIAGAVAPFSVVSRSSGDSGYELTVNKQPESGIEVGVLGGVSYSDQSLNIADEKWHSISIRMLAQRAVVLLDGVKIFDMQLDEPAVSGKLILSVNTANVLFSAISLAEVSQEDMDTVADYDFSTDTYQNALPGPKWSFDTSDDVSGYKTVSSWASGKIISASTNESVLSLSKVKDFALSFTAQWTNATNAWQRGVQVTLPNGKTVNISGSRCCFSDATEVVDHDAVGTSFHRYDVVLSGTTLKVFIDRIQVYEKTVKAATTASNIAITTHSGSQGDPYKFKDVVLKTGSGVHDPEPPDELKLPDTIYTQLNNNGWIRDGMSVYSTDTTVEKPYSGWGCAIAQEQNFILNFNLKISADEATGFELRLRHSVPPGHNTGYRLEFFNNRVTIAKYNDNNYQNTVISTVSKDFSSGVDVRIVMNEGMFWIAFDGVRLFRIDDAYIEKGNIQLSHNASMAVKATVISGIELLRYKEKTANAGVTDPIVTDDILTGDDVVAGLSTAGWKKIDGGMGATAETIYGEYTGWGSKIVEAKNFIFNYTLKFDSKENGNMELRLRHTLEPDHNTGYRLFFTKDTLTIGKYNDDSFQNTQIGKLVTDFTKGVEVRIVMNEGMFWIAFDGVRVFRIDDAYNENGFIQLSHSKGMAENGVTVTDISLLKYSDEKANDGVTDKNNGESDILMTTNEILAALAESTWVRKGDNSVSNLKSTGKGVQAGSEKDFILDFTLRISPAETGSLQVRVRHDYNNVSNLGYVVLFSSSGVSLNRYNDNNYQFSKMDSRSIDFSKSSKIRVVAKSNLIWVSVNGEKIFEIKDAYNEKSKIILQNGFESEGTVYLSDPVLYKYTDKRAGETVTAPPSDTTDFPVSEMVSPDKILELFKNGKHDITENSVLNNTAGSGKGVNICATKNFILNFKLKMAKGEAGGVTIKFRHYYENANFGYVLNLDRKSAALTRYLEQNNGNVTTYGSEKVDFTKGVNVRIVANEGLVWIAFDSVKKFELTDAALYSGQIQFLLSGENGVIELSDFSLTSYGEEESYAGMTNRKLQITTPKMIRDYEVGNQVDVEKLFYGRFDYEDVDGIPTIKFSSEGQGRETAFYGQKLDNFVFSFNVNMDSCSSVNTLQMNFRKTYDSKRNYGFVVTLTQNMVQLNNYSEGSFSVGKLLGKSTVKMKGWVPVKIVANGADVAVIINDQPVIKSKVADIAGGIISFQNNLSGTNNIYFSDILLTEFYDGALPEGEVLSISTPTNIARKTYKDPVKIVSDYKKTNQVSNEESGIAPVIVIAGAAVLIVALAGFIVGFLVVKKRKKRS